MYKLGKHQEFVSLQLPCLRFGTVDPDPYCELGSCGWLLNSSLVLTC
uniref:Uncharacterized protein n=1 Tax=Arundo donax TaxID=35708 RepID=A0A0A9FEX9_ARUDO